MKNRRRIRAVSLLIVFLMSWWNRQPVELKAEEKQFTEQLYARSAVLMDADSGRILFEKEGNAVRPMASTTKIMTCILALEEGKPDSEVKVSEEACRQPQVRLGVQKGETYRLKDLLYSLMLESHNDSAVLVAEKVAGSVPEFAAKMNKKAKEIGCKDTHFVTPNGLDDSDTKGVHRTTAEDLARIFRYCIMQSPKKEQFLEITREETYSFQNIEQTRTFSCRNHNAFLKMMEGALSGKTGFTAKAGYCYIGALRKDNRTFIVALLACGWPGNRSYKWKDTRKLMEYGLKNYQKAELPGEEGIQVYIKDAVNKGNPYRKGEHLTAHIREDKKEILMRKDEKLKIKKKIPKNLHAPVKKGEQMGEAQYFLDGKAVCASPIIADETVERRSPRECLALVMKKLFLLP